jgi:hypothetical protein
MRRNRHIKMGMVLCSLFFFSFLSVRVVAQPLSAYSIKNGRMYIQLTKDIRESALDSFIVQYELQDLDLKNS